MKTKLSTILLIDDDSISNYITEELIREKGLCQTVITVTDGKQGLNYLQDILQANPAGLRHVLVLLDLNMPVMDGFEFMEELEALQLHQQLTIAVLTSSDNHKDISQANNYHFAAYLQKPLSINEISTVVAQRFN